MFVSEAAFDAFREHIPDWDPLDETYGQDFNGVSGFEPFMSNRGAEGDFLEERDVMNSQDILEDLALPLFDLDQTANILPLSENLISVDGTVGNLAQEIDELLPTAHIMSQEQHEALLHDNDNIHPAPSLSEPLRRTVKPPPLSTPTYTTTNTFTPSQQEKLRRSAILQYSPADFGRSESAHSDASDVTGVSARSSRTGPLSELARQGMNAVRKTKACWRCIFLRKKCDPESPCPICPICPKGGKSNWETLGCHRGDFKDRILLLRFCPAECQENANDLVHLENQSFEPDYKDRDLWVNNLVDTTEATESQSSQDTTGRLFLEAIEGKFKLLNELQSPAVLRPLRFCTICIVWELLQELESLAVLGTGWTVYNFLKISPAAVAYQGILESDRLIAQSLICLRTCLEVFGFRNIIEPEKQKSCIWPRCIYTCVTELDLNIERYLDELSRVFFKKENLRNRGPSRLSTFYSFCIQSLVRTALLQVTKRSELALARYAATQYLYLPLRLFVASNSGPSYKDPLLSDEATESGLPCPEAYQQAREAVSCADWHLNGIQNSGDYLKQLFQNDGGDLIVNSAKPQGDVFTDEEREQGSSKRKRLNPWKCRQCREARKKCLPVDRKWPQKCNRCVAHRPEALCCSEPSLNDGRPNKRRPAKPKQVRRTESVGSGPSQEITNWSSDGTEVYERPVRR